MRTTDYINKPYIDAPYYTSVFKPNKNAMIQGPYNNVNAHIANFESFVARASELADRLLNNKITHLGGIDFVSPYPQSLIKKAVGAFVQNWFLQGYNVADIDNTIGIGSFSLSQVKSNESLRKMIPLDALWNLQKTEMWDGIAVGVDIEKHLQSLGYNLKDLLFVDEALQLFQLKGNYDDNFHKDIDFSNELQGFNTNRWICIARTDKKNISFEILGGNSTGLVKSLVMLSIGYISGIYQYEQNLSLDLPDYYTKDEGNGITSIWVEVDDKLPKDKATFLISNIYADDSGEYGMLGSVTNDSGLVKIPKFNILEKADLNQINQNITHLEGSLNTLESNLQQILTTINGISANTNDIPQIKVDVNKLKVDVAKNIGDIVAVSNNLEFLRDVVTAGFEKTLSNDGERAFDPTYVPTLPYHGTTKKYVDDLITVIQNTLAQTPYTGWEALWTGTLNGTKKTGDNGLYFALTGLTPSKGALRHNEGQMEFITFETGGTDDNPEVMIVRTDNKLDRLDIQTGTAYYYKGNINTNGEVQVRRYNQTNGNEVDLPIADLKIVRVYQINGVQTTADATMDDTAITALEGVN